MHIEAGIAALKMTIAEMRGRKTIVVTGPYGEICLKVHSQTLDEPVLTVIEDYMRQSLKAAGTLYIIQQIDFMFIDEERQVKQPYANVWGFGLFSEDKSVITGPIAPMNLDQLIEASQLDFITVRFGPGLLFQDASHWTIENRFQPAP